MKFRSTLASIVLAVSIGNATASPQECVQPDPQALRKTWQAFRIATLEGKPEQVAKCYKFPMKLLSPMDGDPAIKVARSAFLANYSLLFRGEPEDGEVELWKAMKKTHGNEYIEKPFLDTAKCVSHARIDDYNFVYDRSGTWRIESVYYYDDWIVKGMKLDK